MNKDRTVSIYALIDPRTGMLRYIGKAVIPEKRLRSHLYNCYLARNHRECWLKGLVDAGLKPGVVILETCDDSVWVERERWWIAYYKSVGLDLVNGTDGGDGLLNPSKEARERMAAGVSAAHLGRKFTDSHKAAMSTAHKGRTPARSTRNAVSAANSTRIWTDEARAKLSMAHKGSKVPQDRKEKISKSRSHTYTLISPEGQEVVIERLSKLPTEDRNILRNLLYDPHRSHYEGWRLVRSTP